MTDNERSAEQPARISVVIPLYNKGPHILRALDSVAAQTRAADEIIVVNDSSVDDGPRLVEAYPDPRIKLIHRTTPGPGGYAARNAGIEAATGDWIAFLDADDRWEPTALAEIDALARKADPGISVLFTAYARDFGRGDLVDAPYRAYAKGEFRRLDLDAFIDAWLATGESPLWTSAVAARKTAIVEAGMFPAGKCDRGGDKDTWIRLMTVGDALYSPTVTSVYQCDSVNMVTKSTNANRNPYLCKTLLQLLPGAGARRAGQLRRLVNWEKYCRAREAWRRGLMPSREIYDGFFLRSDLKLFLGMVGMSATAPLKKLASRR